MGFFDWLFKKKKYEVEEDSDQEQYLKTDFDDGKKSAPKKAEEPKEAKPKAQFIK